MNVTQRGAFLNALDLYDEMHAAVDERTIAIVEQRRRTAVVKGRGWLVRRMLLAADLLGLVVSILVAEWVVNWHDGVGVFATGTELVAFIATLPAWVVIAKLYGLYDHDEERTSHSTTDDFAGVFHMVTVCTWLFFAIAYVIELGSPPPPKLFIFWLTAICSVSVGRAAARTIARRHPAYVQNTLIVGAGEVGQRVAKKLLQHPEYGVNLVGFIDAEPKERRDDLAHLTLLGGLDRLPAAVRLFDVERVILAFSRASHEEMLELIRSLKDLEIQVDIVPRLFELVGPTSSIYTIEGLPLLGLPRPRLSRSSRLLKRTTDLAVSLTGLLVLAPLFVLVAAAIKLDSRGPVFFRQVRMGSGDRTFRIRKFRTMVADADERKHEVAHLNKHLAPGGDPRMFKVPDDPRVTRVGRLLRRYSLDELPQLINVAKGEMSLVGPRPLILDEDRLIGTWGRQRLDLKPGITGPWQVNGRTGIPFDEMVKLDYLYVTCWSLGGDLKLLFLTIPTILRKQDAY